MITIGMKVESLNFGMVTAVTGCRKQKLRGERITVRFENSGREKSALAPAFLSGNLSDLHELKVGDVFKSSMDGPFEVIGYQGNKNVTVRFINTGNVESALQKDAVLCGYVRDVAKRDAEMGPARAEREEASKKHQQKLEDSRKRAKEYAEGVAARSKAREIEAERKRVEDEARRAELQREREQYEKDLRDNAIRALTAVHTTKDENPNDLNLDFKDRDGNWVLRFGYKGDFVQTRLGRLHNNMTQRAGRLSGYLDVTVAEHFKDAQQFCDWAVAQQGWGHGYVLDKDLLLPGNRQYCAEACSFLPHRINYAIITPKAKSVVKKSKDGYKVTCTANGLKIFLGVYPSEGEGLEAYRKYRKEYVRSLAEFYKNFISDRAYQALLGWEPKENM